MKKKLILHLFALTAFVGLTGCDIGSSNSGTCKTQNVGVAATSVAGPPAAAVGDTVILEVGFDVANSCYEFQTFFQESVGSFEKEITVNVQSEGCNCGDTEVALTQAYTFKPVTAGTYVFKFKKTSVPEETFITHTVVVE